MRPAPLASARTLAVPCLLAFSIHAAAARPADPPAPNIFHFHEANILGTSLDLTLCAASPADADAAHAALLTEIARLDQLLSTHRTGTDLARVNASRDPVKVAPEVLDVLQQYDRWAAKTNNAFSGHLGAVIALWKSAQASNAAPSAQQLTAAAQSLNAPLWKIDPAAGTVQRLSDGLIDIDSLGKGFVASHAAALARQKVPALRGLLLDIGGDIVALGSSSLTTASPWTVGIADPAHPADNAPPLTLLRLQDRSVATSGSYERGFTIAGKKYSHLLDPRTAAPVDFPGPRDVSVASATVVANDAATANALAAALNVLHPGEGLDLVASVPGAEALIVLNNGSQMRSAGFQRLETSAENANASPWPDNYQLSLTLQFDTNIGRRPERPYVAVWVENDKGQHVATLAEWGNNGRWINSLSSWLQATRADNQLLRAVSRATRPAGKYTLTWNGTDLHGNPVPAGTYKLFVEFAYDHNGHSLSSTTITCDTKPTTATLPHTQHFTDVAIAYAPKDPH